MDRKTMRAIGDEEMRDAALEGKRGNFNLDQAIQAMLKYKERGEAVSYRFNGFKLESTKISPESVDKIKEEYHKAISSAVPRQLYDEEMRDAALEGKRGNFNLDQAIQAMLKYKQKGESVYYIFNGFELNSDEIQSLEETKEMYDLFLKEESYQDGLISIKNATREALASGISIEEINQLLKDIVNDKGEQTHDKQ